MYRCHFAFDLLCSITQGASMAFQKMAVLNMPQSGELEFPFSFQVSHLLDHPDVLAQKLFDVHYFPINPKSGANTKSSISKIHRRFIRSFSVIITNSVTKYL
jgi:hypothetical protein